MFLNNAIHQYLNKHIDVYMLKKGSELVKNKFVQNARHIKSEKYISVIVKDVNLVKIYYSNAFTISNITCGCRTQINCEHISAALYYLLSINDNNLIEVENTIKRDVHYKDSKKESKIRNLQSTEPEEKKFLEFIPANQFKVLPAKSQTDLNKIMPYIRPPFAASLGYYMRFIVVLNQDGFLVFATVNQYDLSYKKVKLPDIISRPEYVKVYFKHENNQIYFRCSTCSKNDGKLCEHQYFALNEIKFINPLFSLKWTDRNKLVDLFTSHLKITPQKFGKLYQIIFENNEPELVLTAENYLSENQLREQIKTARNFFNVKNEDTESFIEHLQVKSKSLKSNALMWVSRAMGYDSPLILEGNMPKGGGKLSTNINVVSSPLHFNEEQEEFYRQITSLKNEYHKDLKNGFNKLMLQFLKSRMEILKKIVHYGVGHYDGYNKPAKKDLTLISFDEELTDLLFDTEEDEDFYTVRIYAKIGENLISLENDEYNLFTYFIVYNNTAYLYKSVEVSEFLLSFDDGNYFIADKDNPEALVQLLNEFARHFEVNYPSHIIPQSLKVENPTKSLYMKDGGNYVVFQPRFTLEDGQYIILPNSGKFISENNENINPVFYEIPEEQENSFLEFLSNQHPAFAESFKKTGNFYIEIKDLIRHAWFLKFFEACKEEKINVYGQENLTNFRFNTNSANVSLNISSGIDWFDVNVEITFGEQKVQLKNWVESVRNNERYVLLDDGSLGLIPDEWYEKLKQVALASDEDKGKLKISKFRFGIIDEMFEELSDDKMMKEIKSKMKQLQHYEFKNIYPIPSEIKADLREYQMMGFRWLKALNELGFGGCLADDMGLGKTVQVLSLLSDQKNLNKGTSLAIVPRSLLFNWAAEIDKFCPTLTYINYHGPDRILKRNVLMDFDLVITTYDTATNDIDFFKDILFNYVILDESQAIKNPSSKRYKAMRLLKALNRVVMTGTPVENNTFDLYAQFSFINPGIFGSQQYFRERFAMAIDKDQDTDTAKLLKKMINPFLMRRTKEQVATDLPDRVENIIYCEMDSVQRTFYDALKNTIKSEIEAAVTGKGFDKARFKIIEGLLRLRQVCNAPQLVDPSLPAHKRSSVKIETLMDIIENDLNNHNALIFSQFTSMLDIVRSYLDRKEIKYAYLDGSTKDRKGAVQYFEQNDDVKLFLLSLKAGNTGLNLTKADYVYLIDPWWNPAVEAQAIDRTHRIGQTKNVFAYKMICKNTIEEKIIELQSKKKKLASDLVVTDENVFKSLDKDEIIALFN